MNAAEMVTKDDELHPGDTVEIRFGEIEVFLQKCCNCGFWHKLEFKVLDDRLLITFNEISMEAPEVEESVQEKLKIHRH